MKNPTYEQFRNDPKHRNLSKRQVDAAWAQHKSSLATRNVVSRPATSPRTSNHSLSKRKNHSLTVKQIASYSDHLLLDYYLSNLNPWKKSSAVRIPDGSGGLTPSVCSQHYETDRIGVVALTSGYGMNIHVRPDIDRFSTINQVSGNNCVLRTNAWFAMVGSAAQKERYESFRVVNQAIRVRYDGPISTAQGVIGAMLLPPGFERENMSFQNLANMPYAKIGPAIDGIEVSTIPFGNTDGWRRTKMTPNPISGLTADEWDSGASNPGPQSAEDTRFIFSKFFSASIITSGIQQQIDDVTQVSDLPELVVFGYDLPVDGAFIYEVVTNFEYQVERRSNIPGGASQPAAVSPEKLTNLQTQFRDAAGSGHGVVSTKNSPSHPRLIGKNKNSLVNSLYESAKKYGPSLVQGVGSLVFDNIEAASIASAAAEWAAPTAIEAGLGALALI